MGSFVGIFKELRPKEELVFQTNVVSPVIFVKEAVTKGVVRRGRREIPISIAQANVYLTNKRLLFLVLYQLHAVEISSTDSRMPRLSGVSGTWFEMPLSAIKHVEMRPLALLKAKDMEAFLMRAIKDPREREELLKRPAIELIYNERAAVGRAKDYMASLLKMGLFARLFTRLEKVSDKLLVVGEEVVSVMPTLRGAIGSRELDTKVHRR